MPPTIMWPLPQEAECTLRLVCTFTYISTCPSEGTEKHCIKKEQQHHSRAKNSSCTHRHTTAPHTPLAPTLNKHRQLIPHANSTWRTSPRRQTQMDNQRIQQIEVHKHGKHPHITRPFSLDVRQRHSRLLTADRAQIHGSLSALRQGTMERKRRESTVRVEEKQQDKQEGERETEVGE